MNLRGAGVIGGQAVGQLSLIVVIPVLTRVFPPHQFGLYQIAFVVGLLLQPIATLRMEYRVPVARGRRERVRSTRLGYSALAASLVVVLVVAGVSALAGDRDLARQAALAILLAATFGWAALDNALLIRQGEVVRLAWRNALSGLLGAGLQLLTAVTIESIAALVFSLVVGRGLAILVTRPPRMEEEEVEAGPLRPKAIAYSVLTGLVSVASLQTFPLLAGGLFGTGAAGTAGLAQRISGAPFALVGQGLSQFSQARIAPLVRERSDSLQGAVRRQALVLTAPALVSMIAIAVAGPLLAEPVLGPGWKQAGVLMAILAPPTSLQLVISPLIVIFLMIERERSLFVLQLVRLIASIGFAAIVGASTGSLYWTAAAFSAAITVTYVLMFLQLDRALGDRARG